MFLQLLKNKGPEEQTVAERTALAVRNPISGVPTVVTHLIPATVTKQATPFSEVGKEAT